MAYHCTPPPRASANVRVEVLPNGLARVFDYGPKWAALYDPQGRYQGGGVDRPEYRRAALATFATFATVATVAGGAS